MNEPMFNFTPEQREAAEALAKRMTDGGITLTADEAQIMANLGQWVQPTIDEDPKALGTKAVRALTKNTATAEACLALVAKHVVMQHTLTYEGDVNLRALSTLQMLVAVLATLTRDNRPKHLHG